MIKVLKQDSETLKKIESLNIFLTENNIEIHQTTCKGIVVKVNNQYFMPTDENFGIYILPPFFEVKYILCDINGNTDFYQE